jgi:replication factor C subunit 3/5
MQVTKQEKITVTKQGIDTIIKRSNGDMRKVLNILQSTSMSYTTISEQNINYCLGYPTQQQIQSIMQILIEKNFKKAYDKILQFKSQYGICLGDIITELHDLLVNYTIHPETAPYSNILTQNSITNILDKMRTIEFNNSVNAIEMIQISGLIGIFIYNI